MNTALMMFYLVLFVAPTSNFFHELGHLLGARLAKADVITITIGRGKEVLKLEYQNIGIQIGILFFTSAVTSSSREKPYGSFEMIYISFLGPFFNAIIVFICYPLYQDLTNPYFLLFILYNGWLFMMNCIPYKIGKQESDGYVIMKEIFQKNVY